MTLLADNLVNNDSANHLVLADGLLNPPHVA
jgi:hypothetical protein